MKAIFVNENGCIPYAAAIVNGYKPIETRSRNMLSALVGERIAIVRTKRGKRPTIVGYANMTRYEFCPFCLFEMYRDLTLIPQAAPMMLRVKENGFIGLKTQNRANRTRCRLLRSGMAGLGVNFKKGSAENEYLQRINL